MFYHTAPLGDLPAGLAMALAENSAAMTAFANLPRVRQKQLIKSALWSTRKEDLNDLVSSLIPNSERTQ